MTTIARHYLDRLAADWITAAGVVAEWLVYTATAGLILLFVGLAVVDFLERRGQA